MNAFTPADYDLIREGCIKSARAVVPYVHELVKPKTVIDVGGGEGWWALEFAALGCDCLVLDESLERGRSHLSSGGTVAWEIVPLQTWHASPPSGSYDLAICLETGEHVPEEFADGLVAGLCQLAPVILWSAAIPHQGGHGHVNEQWPDYWLAKFMQHGYEGHDCIRPAFWDDFRVEPWYRQNLMLLVREFSPLLNKATIGQAYEPVSLVHPAIYQWRVEERDRARRVLYPEPETNEGTVWNG